MFTFEVDSGANICTCEEGVALFLLVSGALNLDSITSERTAISSTGLKSLNKYLIPPVAASDTSAPE